MGMSDTVANYRGLAHGDEIANVYFTVQFSANEDPEIHQNFQEFSCKALKMIASAIIGFIVLSSTSEIIYFSFSIFFSFSL